MLSIGKLGAGGAHYYTDGLGAVDEYYSEAGAHSGVWLGKGASLLGLDGEVDPALFSRVLDGRDPATGERLSRSRSSVPGFDLCFRAPKSVSLLQALADPETAAAVLDAHHRAVHEAVGWLETNATTVRRGHAGGDVIAAAGLVAAGFEHFTSRAGDPHLHTHLVAANLARGADGRWSALDGRALYRQARTAGFLYEAALRDQLTRTLGVEWGPVVNGIADLAGVPREVIREFSQRRAQIEAELAAQGASSPRAAQVAALSTRTGKDRLHSADELRRQWRARSASMGIEPTAWSELVRGARQPGDLDVAALADRLLGSDGLTSGRSTFDAADVLRAVAEAAADGAPVAAVDAACRAILGDERAVAVGDGPGGVRWSTTELIGIERQLLRTAGQSRASGVAVVDGEVLSAALRLRPSLSTQQKAMVEALCRSGDGVQVVVGVAGAGKTYALRAAYEAWRSQGTRVIGAALSARAAEELTEGSRIPSRTIASLITDLTDPRSPGLAPRSVLVIDEAAMVSTRDLAVLAAHARTANAKLVLVGDDRQLPAIGAGGTFAGLADQVGTVYLTENRRQALTWERDALSALRAGRSEVALAAYHANDRHHHGADRAAVLEQLVADWAGARQAGTQALMLATTRADVDRLNQMGRQHLRSSGVIGPDLLAVAGRAFAVGDEILCTRNDRRLGVINGTRGTVESLEPATGGLVAVTAEGRRFELPAGYLDAGHVTHAYATTVHKAQGATTDRTFILADEHLYLESGYVALSRGRHGNDIYTADPGRDDERHGPLRQERVGGLRASLERSRAQQAATVAPRLPGRRLDDLEAERRSLGQAMAAGQIDRPAGREKHDQLCRLVDQRTKALGAWALEHPDIEHLRLLGAAPRHPGRRAEWARAAAEISAYRERHGLDFHPDLEPDARLQRWDHERVKRVLLEVEPALDRSRPLQLGLDRDLGLGL